MAMYMYLYKAVTVLSMDWHMKDCMLKIKWITNEGMSNTRDVIVLMADRGQEVNAAFIHVFVSNSGD